MNNEFRVFKPTVLPSYSRLPNTRVFWVMRRMLVLMFILSFAFLAPWSDVNAGTIVAKGGLGKGNLKVTEVGLEGMNFNVYPTWLDDKGETHYFVRDIEAADTIPCEDGFCVGTQLNMDKPLNNGTGSYYNDFTFQSQYSDDLGTHKVTNYEQRTGDPGTLFASVFVNGFMVDSLEDWFAANYPDTPIFQPDFVSVSGGDIYYGVNLADLVTEGTTFVQNHAISDIFTIGASGELLDLPHYVFSTTPLDYVPGVGWKGTPLPLGTQIEYVAFHQTEYVPEPSSIVLAGLGLVGLIVLHSQRRSSFPRSSVGTPLLA